MPIFSCLWAFSLLAAMPFDILFHTQLITLQSFGGVFGWAFSNIGVFLLEYLILLCLCSFIYGLFRRLWAALLLPELILLAAALVSHYKTVINGSPLVLRDLTFVSQFSEIFGFAQSQITFSLHTISAILLFVLTAVLLFILDRRIKKARLLSPIMALVSCLLLVLLVCTPAMSLWLDSVERDGISEEERAEIYGPAFGLYASYVDGKRQMAALASASLDELTMQIESLEIKEGENLQTPNVIFLMSESFFDVTKLPDVSFSKDPIPVFRGLAEKYTSGDFISNTYSGGTGYVEMEVLTGICSNLLKDSETLTSLAPNSKYLEIPTIADIFSEYGYKTGFIHSYNSNLYNREAIYGNFGFDEVLFETSFSPDVEMRGGYISDMALSQKIIERFEEKGDEPMFMFALSMENHQPYTAEKFDEELDIEIESEKLNDEEREMLASYVQGLQDADKALGALIEYFEDSDEQVMIVFFGDHLPNLKINDRETIYSRLGYSSTAVTTDWQPQELAKMLSTDYVIWTNYEEKPLPDKTESGNMLGISVLDRLGMKLNSYYAWLDAFVAPHMLIYRPRLYVTASGDAYSTIPEEHREMMENYRLAVWDMVYGDGNIFKIERETGGKK